MVPSSPYFHKWIYKGLDLCNIWRTKTQISMHILISYSFVLVTLYSEKPWFISLIKIPTFLVILIKQFYRSEYAGTLSSFGSDIFFISFIQYFYHIMMMNQHFTLFTCWCGLTKLILALLLSPPGVPLHAFCPSDEAKNY